MATKKVDAVAIKDASLFEISNDLKALFFEIEEMGGELTDEMNEQLTIKQEQLSVKLEKYVCAVKAMTGYVDSCKKEKERIGNIQKRNEANIQRLKKALGEAVMEFGDVTKSGTHFINAGFSKISCRESSGCVIDTEFTKFVIDKCVEYMRNLYSNEGIIFYKSPESNMIGLIEFVNNAIKDRFPDSDYYVDEDILDSIMVKTSFQGSLIDIMKIKSISASVISGISVVSDDNNITKAKEMIKEGKVVNYLYKNNDYVVTIS